MAAAMAAIELEIKMSRAANTIPATLLWSVAFSRFALEPAAAQVFH
jgi:hypothetical protein